MSFSDSDSFSWWTFLHFAFLLHLHFNLYRCLYTEWKFTNFSTILSGKTKSQNISWNWFLAYKSELQIRWFHGIFVQEIHSHTQKKKKKSWNQLLYVKLLISRKFRQIFREINALMYLLLNVLFSRNILEVRGNVSFFTLHSKLWKLRNFIATVFSQKFRQINVLLKN